MKLPKSIRIKDTTSLFLDKYEYKIVLVCPVANWFRGNNLAFVSSKLAELTDKQIASQPWIKIKTPEDKEYCHDLCKLMETLGDYDLRVEHPFVNFYTNTTVNIEKLASLDADRVKYISLPNKNNPSLVHGSVIVKRLDYDYKVHVGRTRKSHKNFVDWSANTSKIKLTKKVKRDLISESSWGGSYFYVKGDNTLTMVRMFLGSDISKIESVIKA